MKKKILWLKPTKGRISIGRYLIAEELRKMGIDVEVFECSGLKSISSLLHALKSNFDAVIGTTHLGLVIGGLVKILRGKKFIADFVDEYTLLTRIYPPYSYPLVYIIIMLEKLFLKIADAVIVVPKAEYDLLSKKRKNVYKTNLCVDLKRFLKVKRETIECTKKILKKAGVDLSRPKIVYVGGFNKIYNLDKLVKTMKNLRDFQLIMIGGGEMEYELKRMKKEENLNNVFFLGYLPNDVVAGILRMCDIGITLCDVPRQLKIYEYLASGLKVIVPERLLNSEDFVFKDSCIGVKLNVEDIERTIKYAHNTELSEKNLKTLINYDCRAVAKIYNFVLKMSCASTSNCRSA